jgi:hypothetical protein
MMILFDVVKLATPGVIVGMILTVAFMRLNSQNMGIPQPGRVALLHRRRGDRRARRRSGQSRAGTARSVDAADDRHAIAVDQSVGAYVRVASSLRT